MAIHRKGPETPELMSEYLAGSSTVELARKYGMRPSGVNGRLTRAGVQLREPRRRAVYDDPNKTALVVSSYRSGLPMIDVAPILGITHSTVQRALKAAGVRIRPHGLRRRTIKIPTDPVAIGYLAGLLDGEGHLAIQNKKDTGSVACRLSIYSTTPGIMKWLLANVGGSVVYDTARTKRHGWLPIGSWNLYRAQDTAAVLRVLLPYLIVKKQVAESAMRLFADRFEIQDSPPTTSQSSDGK